MDVCWTFLHFPSDTQYIYILYNIYLDSYLGFLNEPHNFFKRLLLIYANYGNPYQYNEMGYYLYITLPETNSSHLKIDGWKMSLLLGFGLFSGAFAVSFRECTVLDFWVLQIAVIGFGQWMSMWETPSKRHNGTRTLPPKTPFSSGKFARFLYRLETEWTMMSS